MEPEKKLLFQFLVCFILVLNKKFYLQIFSGLNSETISEKNSKVTAYSKKSINYHFLKKLFFQTANFIKMQTV